MRVKGDNAPSNAFTLEAQPKRPGFVLARFYENVEPFESTDNGLTTRGFVYDEYRLELESADGLTDDILNNYATYMNEAKLREAEQETIPTLKERVAQLEAEKAQGEENIELLKGCIMELADVVFGEEALL